MLELFSRHPDFPLHGDDVEVGPLPVDDDISSLSAILLDDAYYDFLTKGLARVDGLSIVDAEHLVPLKVRAHIDLNARKTAGQHVNGVDLKKHKKDVLRLMTVIPNAARIEIGDKIAADLSRFVADMRAENLRVDQLGIGMTLEEALVRIERAYGL